MPLPVADDAPGVYGRPVAGVDRLATTTALVLCWHFHLLLGWFVILGVSAGIFGRFAPAVAHFHEDPFRYRHIVDRGAAADLTKGNVFW